MKKAVWLILVCALSANISACNGKPADQPATAVQGAKKQASEPKGGDHELAGAFLAGIQRGDKAGMYRATSLTPELVNGSRDRLIYIKKEKLTDQQRQNCEHVLKISGDVDFFLKKLRPLLPESAKVSITGMKPAGKAGVPVHLVHVVTVAYADQASAVRDKTGKAVKELRLHLQQFDYPLESGAVREFSFSSADFEKFADRDFEVLSYF